MKILSFDISTKPGWAFKEDAQLVAFDSMSLEQPILAYGEYPWSYDSASEVLALRLWEIVIRYQPDVIVIEETNLGKSRYAQKTLEFIHKAFLNKMRGWTGKIIYLSSSVWRQTLGLQMSKEDKKNNSKLGKANKVADQYGVKLDKKKLGIRGKVTKKHLAIRYVNETYGLSLKVKDNDKADAICLADAYLKGAVACDGVM